MRISPEGWGDGNDLLQSVWGWLDWVGIYEETFELFLPITSVGIYHPCAMSGRLYYKKINMKMVHNKMLLIFLLFHWVMDYLERW